jgi:hypothetical protein
VIIWKHFENLLFKNMAGYYLSRILVHLVAAAAAAAMECAIALFQAHFRVMNVRPI